MTKFLKFNFPGEEILKSKRCVQNPGFGKKMKFKRELRRLKFRLCNGRENFIFLFEWNLIQLMIQFY